MNTVIIAGSSRNDGDTKLLTDELRRQTNWDLIDLNDYNFSYYDYNHENRKDDFLPLIRSVLKNYEVLIFVTPVYWYSMSGIMKVFFDRISDLLTIEKELGRTFRGKKMAVISSSNGNNLGDQFWLPFRESANYLGMQYLGNLHTYAGEDNKPALSNFLSVLQIRED